VVRETSERACDPKIPETRSAVLSNQYVALDITGCQREAHSFPSFCLLEQCHRAKYLTHGGTSGRCTLVRATVGVVSRLSSLSFELMGAYQCQPIGTWVPLGIVDNIPIRHPRIHDAERK
jgi:hypothetical protein